MAQVVNPENDQLILEADPTSLGNAWFERMEELEVKKLKIAGKYTQQGQTAVVQELAFLIDNVIPEIGKKYQIVPEGNGQEVRVVDSEGTTVFFGSSDFFGTMSSIASLFEVAAAYLDEDP